ASASSPLTWAAFASVRQPAGSEAASRTNSAGVSTGRFRKQVQGQGRGWAIGAKLRPFYHRKTRWIVQAPAQRRATATQARPERSRTGAIGAKVIYEIAEVGPQRVVFVTHPRARRGRGVLFATAPMVVYVLMVSVLFAL